MVSYPSGQDEFVHLPQTLSPDFRKSSDDSRPPYRKNQLMSNNRLDRVLPCCCTMFHRRRLCRALTSSLRRSSALHRRNSFRHRPEYSRRNNSRCGKCPCSRFCCRTCSENSRSCSRCCNVKRPYNRRFRYNTAMFRHSRSIPGRGRSLWLCNRYFRIRCGLCRSIRKLPLTYSRMGRSCRSIFTVFAAGILSDRVSGTGC